VEPIRTSSRPRVVLADRHALVSEGIALCLSAEIDVVATASDGRALLALVQDHDPDYVVAEIDLPNLSAIDVLRQTRRDGRRARFVFLSDNPSPLLARLALEAGGDGFVLKHETTSDLVNAIRHVDTGHTYLSPSVRSHMHAVRLEGLTEKRRRILRMLADGLRAKQIAAELGISVRTVEHQKYMIMQTFGVHSVLELVVRSKALGLLY
jgi:DNA-binding NarL/FixJ family response regulator